MTEFGDRDQLMREIEELRTRLRAEQEENALLRRLLFIQLEARTKGAEQQEPVPAVSSHAMSLFEALPETFTLEDVFAAGDKRGLLEGEIAEYVRTYLRQEMVVQDVESGRFTKTGKEPSSGGRLRRV